MEQINHDYLSGRVTRMMSRIQLFDLEMHDQFCVLMNSFREANLSRF